ncbi:conjugal transfer protein TraG N-terminal domain-containing protein [Sinimarinibacterium sp. NLF-5-8]|uniref:conjugal transfer protein TraG N-terminal domain-containing protein n=1 Tax=Sinimarinibacterium sp. NLF-5-8 TaxID=2698684 RepID=UPI00137BAF49|nr:conjugal transfer protein TraG N-terminal domain-containing protein [Sinimarinibacterium sp. NLF-5-8]QHS09102.1 hypothetical protein GT972_02340 [Sinimarinibacterium sp. NLF-5-8]
MSKRGLFCLLLIALFAPVMAFAAPLTPGGGSTAWTIYGFANSSVLNSLLWSVSAFVSSSVFKNLTLFLAMIGFLGAIMTTAMGGGTPARIAGTFLYVMIFLYVGLNVKMNVEIRDQMADFSGGYLGALGGSYPALDVPIVVGLPLAIVSTAGKEITEQIETYFSNPGIPRELLTGGGAFNLAPSLIRASTRVKVADPLLRSTIADFAKNCIVPSIVTGRINAAELIHSEDIWKTLRDVNPAPLTFVYTDQNPAGALTTCGPTASTPSSPPTYLQSARNVHPVAVDANNAIDYINDYVDQAAMGWFKSAGAWSNSAAFSWIEGTLTHAQSYLFGNQFTTPNGGSIRQAAAINIMSPALNSAAMASGQSDMVTAIAVAQAEKGQVTGWATAVNLFQDLSGYIYSILQAFLMGMTPLIIAASFIPGAGKGMLKNYFSIVIWLALWQPVLSIINYIVLLYAQANLGGAMGLAGGGAGGAVNYTMANMGMVDEMTSNFILAAGFLATMTPMITWAIVKGSFAFTEFLSKGMGMAMAQTAGATAASGNISLGNQSFDNVSMMQKQLMASTMTGVAAAQDRMTDGHTQTQMDVGGGANIKTAGGTGSVAARSEQMEKAAQASVQSQAARASAIQSLNNTVSALDSIVHSRNDTSTDGSSAGVQLSTAQQESVKREVNNALDTLEKAGIINSAEAKQAKESMVGVSWDSDRLIKGASQILRGMAKMASGAGEATVGAVAGAVQGAAVPQPGLTSGSASPAVAGGGGGQSLVQRAAGAVTGALGGAKSMMAGGVDMAEGLATLFPKVSFNLKGTSTNSVGQQGDHTQQTSNSDRLVSGGGSQEMAAVTKSFGNILQTVTAAAIQQGHTDASQLAKASQSSDEASAGFEQQQRHEQAAAQHYAVAMSFGFTSQAEATATYNQAYQNYMRQGGAPGIVNQVGNDIVAGRGVAAQTAKQTAGAPDVQGAGSTASAVTGETAHVEPGVGQSRLRLDAMGDVVEQVQVLQEDINGRRVANADDYAKIAESVGDASNEQLIQIGDRLNRDSDFIKWRQEKFGEQMYQGSKSLWTGRPDISMIQEYYKDKAKAAGSTQ